MAAAGKLAGTRRAARWLEASIRVPAALADRVGTALIDAGSHGVVTAVHELARGPRRRTHETVRGYFPAAEPARARLAAYAALRALAEPALARARIAWRALDAQLWEIDWREHFQPVVAGTSLVVVPPWNRAPYPGRHRIVIHPGMAFGTGQHETTRSCLEALERLASRDVAAALDVGTGTGVLAIALAKLGVRRVHAIDTDPQALDAARANVRRNRLGARVTFSAMPLGSETRERVGRYPLIVANIYVDALVALAPVFAERVVPGGALVTSGVLRSQQGRLRRAFARTRWIVRGVIRRGPWTTTIFERRDDRAPRGAGTAAALPRRRAGRRR